MTTDRRAERAALRREVAGRLRWLADQVDVIELPAWFLAQIGERTQPLCSLMARVAGREERDATVPDVGRRAEILAAIEPRPLLRRAEAANLIEVPKLPPVRERVVGWWRRNIHFPRRRANTPGRGADAVSCRAGATE